MSENKRHENVPNKRSNKVDILLGKISCSFLVATATLPYKVRRRVRIRAFSSHPEASKFSKKIL